MTHLAATNTLMLHGLASLQKLVLQVCKRWESILHQLRDKLFKEDMVCDVVWRHYQDRIKAIFRNYYSAFQKLLTRCAGVIQVHVIGNAELLLHHNTDYVRVIGRKFLYSCTQRATRLRIPGTDLFGVAWINAAGILSSTKLLCTQPVLDDFPK